MTKEQVAKEEKELDNIKQWMKDPHHHLKSPSNYFLIDYHWQFAKYIVEIRFISEYPNGTWINELFNTRIQRISHIEIKTWKKPYTVCVVEHGAVFPPSFTRDLDFITHFGKDLVLKFEGAIHLWSHEDFGTLVDLGVKLETLE